MSASQSPKNEYRRRQVLAEYTFANAFDEPQLQTIARLAARLCNAPIALVTSVGAEHQEFRANVGLENLTGTPREISFCTHAVATGSFTETADASEDPRFADNPLVTDQPAIRSYFGVPLTVEGEYTLGTLCVIDTEPRSLTAEQRDGLEELGGLVVNLFESRQRALKNQWFGQLLDDSANEIYVFDPETHRFLYVNDGALRTTGYSLEEILELSPADLQPEEALGAFQEAVATLLAGKAPSVLFESVCRRSDGTTYPVMARLHYHSEGRPVLSAVVHDISERKARESELTLYREIFTHASVGITVANARDEDYPLLLVNPAFEQTTGYSQEESQGRNCRFLQGDETNKNSLDDFRVALESSQPAQATIRNYRKNGEEFWNEVRVFPISDDSGEVTHLIGMQTDVTEQVAIKEELIETRNLLQEISDGVPALIAYFDRNQNYRFMNEGYRRRFQVPPGEGIGRSIREVIGETLYESTRLKIEGSLEGVHQQFASEMQGPDGLRTLEVTYLPHRNAAGTDVLGAFVLAVDQTRRKALESALFSSKELAETTFDAIAEGVISTDIEGRIQRMNPVAETLTGWTRTQAQNVPIDLVLLCLDRDSGTPVPNPVLACLSGSEGALPRELLVASRIGEQTAVRLTPSVVRLWDGAAGGAVVVIHDMTESYREYQQLSHRADHDDLTGLPNRALLLDRVERALLSADRTGRLGVLLFLDLDGFKEINDRYGHAVGDRVLCRFARRLTQHLRKVDTVARLGGDEFVVVASDLPDRELVGRLVHKARRISQRPYRIGDLELKAPASIGVVEFCSSKVDAAALIERADRDMYQAKISSKRAEEVATAREIREHPFFARTGLL